MSRLRDREGTGSGGVDDQGRSYTIDPLGYKKYYFEGQPADIKAQHTRGEGGGVFKGDWRWDTDKGEWQRPVNDTFLIAAGNLAAPFVAYGAGALAGGTTTSSGAAGGATTGSGVGIGETAATTGLGGAAKSGVLGKVGNMATGGMSFRDLAKLSLLQFGLGTVGDLMSGSQQERRPFAGAQQSLDSARSGLQGFMPQLQSRLGTPTRLKAPRMPNMSFSGGPLPFKVGLGGSSPVEGYGQGDPIQEAQSILDMLKGRK